ncbi:putative tRNA-dihydrouridine synthase 4 [Trypanosoma theileri]|uniref:Putative tRNA-dihydrouridine synthase 4 n=1 Tax=Trypanosoma theileri TaxID=67003 RepID=A0A1X0PAA8_9TRYP|nr:putative tRNA-dihydrouridine synthase 4 [Trypanosoma theileri]ORC93529.1 putative tRNA-dihydrouridine synthase 4 [Trypanosoma theileri]
MKRIYKDAEDSPCVMPETAMSYIHTDLASMLRNAQSKTLRLAAECQDILTGGVSSPSETLDGIAKLKEAYSGIMKIQAPMVRCSRPAFRKLCRLWGTDINYTHMIMADSFSRSDAARHSDFSIYSGENCLVSQIASCSGPFASQSAVLLAPYCDAIDLNCGCPQRWAMKEGLGSALLQKPEVVADIVRCVRNGLSGGEHDIPCVVKMRVSDDVRRSVDFARQCEAAGCAWITVHGRTPFCTAHAPVRLDAIRLIRESVSVPIVANGGISNPQTALETALSTGVGGVMSGMGVLANPACFYLPREEEKLHFAPQRCVENNDNIPFLSHLGEEGKEEEEEEKKKKRNGSSYSVVNGKTPLRLEGLPCCPVEVISDFIRLSCVMDLASKATSMHLLKMAGNYLSPTERVFVAQMHSSFSITAAFQQLGFYIKEGKFTVDYTTEEELFGVV